MEKSKSNKKRQRNKKMVSRRNPWSFFWHQEKFHKFVFCNEHVWVRNFAKKNLLNFFQHQEKLDEKKMKCCRRKTP
jgi:hypothetical protein